MRPVVLLALAGLIALVVALLTGSTVLAMAVVALAVAGIVVLARDWRTERAAAAEAGPAPVAESGSQSSRADLSPDRFSPDISGDPDGPSSDARAD